MQLSIVRAFDNHSLTPTQLCTDQDFENTLRIMDTFIIHMVCTFKQYPQYKFLQTGPVEKSKALEVKQIRQCRELRANGTPIREIAKIVLKNEGRKSTVERWTK